jgi:glycine/D-amino acid oxidase-like deaminating enzyme
MSALSSTSGSRAAEMTGVAMTNHAVVVAGGGPTGLMLAGELALAGVDVAIVERRASQDLAGSRAGGLHARAIEVLDQRGIADRFLSQDGLGRTPPPPRRSGNSDPAQLRSRTVAFISNIPADRSACCGDDLSRKDTAASRKDDADRRAALSDSHRSGRRISSGAMAVAVSFARRPASNSPGGIRRRAG